jgi:hypothetical protein
MAEAALSALSGYSTDMIRSPWIGVLTLALIGHLACTNAAVDKAVGSATGASTVVVTRGERGITVENRVGRPLLNVRLEIERSDSSPPFVYTLPTLDTGATREIPFAEFRTEDGALFEAGASAATQVKTNARDTLGNRYGATTPWEPKQ